MRVALKSQRRRRSRGQSLVELALIAPVLIVLIVGAAQLGAILYSGITVASAAHDAARVASLNPIKSGAYTVSGSTVSSAGSSTTCPSGTNPVCLTVAQSQGLLGTVTTTIAPGTAQTAGTESPCPAKSVTDGYITVTVSNDVPIFIPFLNNILANTSGGTVRTISTAVTVRVEPCDATNGN